MRFLATLITILLLAGMASAQFVDDAIAQDPNPGNSLGTKPASSPFSLLDLSRVRWSHSYSVGFFSGGFGSGSSGLLNSTMFYDFSPKLSLQLNLGVLHDPGSLVGSGDRDATLLPGFLLEYHPSDKFQMSIGYQKYSASFSNPYYGRYGPWYTR